MSELVSEEETEIKHAKYANRLAKPEHMSTMSAGALVASTKPSSKGIIFRDISDEELRDGLNDYAVNDVKHVLDSIIADKSVKRKLRRQAIARVVKNKPHPTRGFVRYDKWNSDFGWQVDRSDVLTFLTFIITGVVLYSASFLMGGRGLGDILMSLLFGVVPVGFGVLTFFMNTAPLLFHSEAYGLRANMSTEELRIKGEEEAERERIASIEQDRQQLAELTARLSGGKGEVSLVDAKQDFAEAKARVASYETDFDKALRFPAFNDVTVPSTREMVKQMRTCRTMSSTVSVVNAEAFAREVDELWVRIQEAEKMAARIAWSHVGLEEQKNLDRAQKLFVQANDPGNTEVMKENLYAQLKVVVDRLNKKEQILPVKIVAQIEAKKGQVVS